MVIPIPKNCLYAYRCAGRTSWQKVRQITFSCIEINTLLHYWVIAYAFHSVWGIGCFFLATVIAAV